MAKTLGEILSDSRIAQIAPDAIRNMDLTKEDMWNKTLEQLRAEQFGGELEKGLDRLFAAEKTGKWYYPLYSDAECAENPGRKGTNLIWFPSGEKGADDRPFILLVPGGGFVNVWNLTEGWPVAAQFNRLGYHVFILTYQVDEDEHLLENNMEDYYLTVKNKLDGVEVSMKYIKEENHASQINAIENSVQTKKPKKDAYSLLTGWKLQEIHKWIIMKFHAQIT